MRSINRTSLTAMVFAATLAGCSSTPTSTETGGTTPDTTGGEVTRSGGFDDSSTSSTTAVPETDSPQIRDAASALLSTRVFYFDFDKANIKPDGYSALKAHAAYLANTPSARIRLEGHADERGTREYNVALGERRGNSVAKFLRINGVSDTQIEVISYGEEKPAVVGGNDTAYAQNRRVEVEYSAGNP